MLSILCFVACSKSAGAGPGEPSQGRGPGEAARRRITARRWVLFTGAFECLRIQERPNSLAFNYRLEDCLRGVFLETLEEESLLLSREVRSGPHAPLHGSHARRRSRILAWQRSLPPELIDPRTLHNYGSLGWTYGESPWRSRLYLSGRTCSFGHEATAEVAPQTVTVFEKYCGHTVHRIRELIELDSSPQELAKAFIESPPFALDEGRLRELRWSLEMESGPLRGGGLPDALGAPLNDSHAEVEQSIPIVVRPGPAPRYPMDLRIEKVKIRKETMSLEDVTNYLRRQRRHFEHRYQQKFPWAFPAAGQGTADRKGPEGWIQFILTIDQEGRATACRSWEPEDLLDLGDRVCSTLVNRRFPGPRRDPADLSFEVGFFLRPARSPPD